MWYAKVQRALVEICMALITLEQLRECGALVSSVPTSELRGEVICPESFWRSETQPPSASHATVTTTL